MGLRQTEAKSTEAISTETTSSDETAILRSVLRTIDMAAGGIAALAAQVANNAGLSEALVAATRLIANGRGRTVISGIGKSGHIGRKIAATMASTGTSAYFVHATEASHGDLGMITAEDILILLSWSGETAELANMLTYAKRFRVPVISISANGDSILARNSDIAIVLPKVQEACPHGLAPTTSALLQLTIGDALAMALLERRGFSADDFKVFHPGGKLGAQLALVSELAHASGQIPLLREGNSMGDALIEMSTKGFGVVGIVDAEGRLTGVITDGDLRRHMSRDLLQEAVESVMTRRPRVIKGTMLASAALEFMHEQKVTVLFLVDANGQPEGIVNIHDLLRAGVA